MSKLFLALVILLVSSTTSYSRSKVYYRNQSAANGLALYSMYGLGSVNGRTANKLGFKKVKQVCFKNTAVNTKQRGMEKKTPDNVVATSCENKDAKGFIVKCGYWSRNLKASPLYSFTETDSMNEVTGKCDEYFPKPPKSQFEEIKSLIKSLKEELNKCLN